MEQIIYENCGKCCGTGKQIDQVKTGANLRQMREQADLSLREMAEKLKHSPSYISDLELGRRIWTIEKIEHYLSIISQAKQLI